MALRQPRKDLKDERLKRKSGRYAASSTSRQPRGVCGAARASEQYRTRKEAEAAERKALEARDRGDNLDPERVTIAELAERFIKAVAPDLAGQTVSRYEEHLRMHVVPSIGGIRASNLKPAHLAELYAKLRTKRFAMRSETSETDGTASTKERYGVPSGRLRCFAFIGSCTECRAGRSARKSSCVMLRGRRWRLRRRLLRHQRAR